MPIDEEQAPDECVGPSSQEAGKSSGCDGCPNQKACAAGEGRKEDPEIALIQQRLAQVKRKVLVLSGKGGVGKSTMTAQLGFALAAQGLSVGLLDVDICGPSIPQMLGLRGQSVHQSASGWSPVYVTQEGLGGGDDDDDVELGVMSIGFMLPSEDDAVIWRGPRKNGLIKQFLTDVEWGALDYLLIDTPPGTSDEHISLVQYLAKALGPDDGALVVSTPQEVSLMDVRKELSFCAKTKLRVLGVVENMSEYAAPLSTLRFRDAAGLDQTEATLAAIRAKCPELLDLSAVADVFPRARGGAEAMASQFSVPFLGRVPLDPSITKACESGTSYTVGVANGRSALAHIVSGLRASEPKAGAATAPTPGPAPPIEMPSRMKAALERQQAEEAAKHHHGDCCGHDHDHHEGGHTHSHEHSHEHGAPSATAQPMAIA